MFVQRTHEFNDAITCPYCDYEFDNSFEIEPDKEEIGLVECGDCMKEFYAFREIEITYSTAPVKFGTCKKCKKEDVPLESFDAIYCQYEDLCPSCGDIKRNVDFKEYFEKKYESDNK